MAEAEDFSEKDLLLVTRSAQSMTPENLNSSIKRAELLSTAGAAVLGAGIALIFAEHLVGFAVPFVAAGLLAHAAGMFFKHRLEVPVAPQPRWYSVLYWTCWIFLLLIGVLIVVRASR